MGKYNGCSRILQISPLEETTIFTMLFFFLLQMSMKGRIFLGLILVSVWTVEGK